MDARVSLMNILFKEVGKAFQSPSLREAFSSDVVQPLAHSAFGRSVRAMLYAGVTLVLLLVLMVMVLCVLMCLTYAKVCSVLTSLSADS